MENIHKIQHLVGNISERDLAYVDCYACDDLGIFIPSVGFCGYAVQPGHTHPTYSFVIFLSADQGIIDSPPLIPLAGYYAAAVLPPGIPHEEKMGDEFVRYIAIMMTTKLAERICRHYQIRPYDEPVWHAFALSKQILLLIERFMKEYESQPTDDSVLDALGYLIANDLIKGAADIGEDKQIAVNNVIRSAIDYIQQNFARPLTIAVLAEQAGMSVSTFTRKFKDETGETPAAYVLAERLIKARKLMRDREMRLTDIALSCGFSSSAHLTSCFKKNLGMSPREYRSLYINI